MNIKGVHNIKIYWQSAPNFSTKLIDLNNYKEWRDKKNHVLLLGYFDRPDFKIFDLVDLYTLKYFCRMKVYGNYCS